MASWKAAQAIGQLKKKQAKKALSRSLETSSGPTMKLLTHGLLGDSKAEEDRPKDPGKAGEKEQKEENEHISVLFMKRSTKLKEKPKEK